MKGMWITANCSTLLTVRRASDIVRKLVGEASSFSGPIKKASSGLGSQDTSDAVDGDRDLELTLTLGVLGVKLSRLSLDSDSSCCFGGSALQTCICPWGKAFAAGRRPMRLLRRDMEHDSFKRRHRVHCGLSSAKVHFSLAEWHRSHALRTMSTTWKRVTEEEKNEPRSE